MSQKKHYSPEEIEQRRLQDNERRRNRYQTHKEEEQANKREYTRKNKDYLNQKQREWYKNNQDYARARNRENYDILKREVFSHYTPDGYIKCFCCGITDITFLTLDHINNDGASDRKSRNIGKQIYYEIKKLNYPQNPPLQIACYNCNCGRHKNNYICPHAQFNVFDRNTWEVLIG